MNGEVKHGGFWRDLISMGGMVEDDPESKRELSAFTVFGPTPGVRLAGVF